MFGVPHAIHPPRPVNPRVLPHHILRDKLVPTPGIQIVIGRSFHRIVIYGWGHYLVNAFPILTDLVGGPLAVWNTL